MELTTIQRDFADYLAELWLQLRLQTSGGKSPGSGSGLLIHAPTKVWHQYPITTHGAWRSWKSGSPAKTVHHAAAASAARQTRWWCDSFHQAALHYSWTTTGPASFPTLASTLAAHMAAGDESATESTCLQIFKWGSVAAQSSDRSRRWIVSKAKDKNLIAKLKFAAYLLGPSSPFKLKLFGPGGLLMNSAMAKVYAAVDPVNIVIYDGRVGAALCLLVRDFLKGTLAAVVPKDLAFLWGPPRVGPRSMRNPSCAPYTFLSLYSTGIADQHRAEALRRANMILERMRSSLASRNHKVSLSEIGDALFMIGYDVRFH